MKKIGPVQDTLQDSYKNLLEYLRILKCLLRRVWAKQLIPTYLRSQQHVLPLGWKESVWCADLKPWASAEPFKSDMACDQLP